MSTLPDIAGLESIAAGDMPRRAPAPVDDWSPAVEAPIDIRIDAEGRWFHEGERIRRAGLVALFASILRREPDGSHVLVTPAEKRFITVEDCAFVAVSVEARGSGREQVVTIVTNLGDEVAIGPDHPLDMRDSPVAGGGVKLAYVTVRGGLQARVGRAAFHDLVAAGCTKMQDGESWFGLWSSGSFWPMMTAHEAGL